MEQTETVDPESVRKPVNAYFESKLPAIIEEISATLFQIRPHLSEATIRVNELHDYLKFEIEKTKLELSKNAIADQTDPEKLQRDEIWLARLEYLVSEFDPDHVESSVNFLSELKKELEGTFLS